MTKSQTQIAIIRSVFNESITQLLLDGTIERLLQLGFLKSNIKLVEVPGAIEIPLIAKLLAEKGIYAAIIGLGCVIRGETDHFDYVCDQVSWGCQKVMLKYSVPVVFGVLTTHTEQQAMDRVGGHHGHKGHDAADTAVAMIDLITTLTRENQ
jgi:6,7-dimethyl-8-ribityllumazine synthase